MRPTNYYRPRRAESECGAPAERYRLVRNLFRFAIQLHSALICSNASWQRGRPDRRAVWLPVPGSLRLTFLDAVTDESWLFPRNIVVARLQKLTLGISHPLVRKQRDGVVFGDLGSSLKIVFGKGRVKSCWKIPPEPECQMSNLGSPGIYFNEMGIPRMRLQHEIETVQPGKLEPSGVLFGSGGHFGVLDQAQNGGMPGRTHFFEHFKMEAGQNRTLPTGDRAGCFVPSYECLRIEHRSTTRERRPHQGKVPIDQRPFECPRHERRSLQLTKGAFSFFQGVYQFDAIAA